MPVTVTMPQLGETVTEGTILAWAKQPGDMVEEDEVLLEISTDKVDTEVPSPAAGVLQEILVPEGETVGVGTPLAVIGESAESGGPAPEDSDDRTVPPAPEPAAAAMGPTGTPVLEVPVGEADTALPDVVFTADEAAPSEIMAPAASAAAEESATPIVATGDLGPSPSAPRRGILSPVVRRLAAEQNVDLSRVSGTGEGGRITRKDVETFMAAGDAPSDVPVSEAPAPTKVTLEPSSQAVATEPVPAPVSAPAQEPEAPSAPTVPELPIAAASATSVPATAPEPEAPTQPPPPAPEPVEAPAPAGAPDAVVPASRIRQRIADNMVLAKRTAAHVWTSVEVDFERVEQARRRHKEAFKTHEGFSLTYLPFIARATMDALAAFPVVNSSFDIEDSTYTFHNAVNLGIAVDMNQEGLVVMTVRNADGLTLKGIAREIRAKALKARSGKLDPDDVIGSTFTVTNPGPYGSFMSAPIINVPNVAILSTDTVVKRPSVVSLPDGGDSIAIRHIGYLGLTWDHRAFDGSTAVLFLRRIQQNLETWDWEQELA